MSTGSEGGGVFFLLQDGLTTLLVQRKDINTKRPRLSNQEDIVDTDVGIMHAFT